MSDKPHAKPSHRLLLTGAGAAAANRVALSIGALDAVPIASRPEGMDVERILDRKHLRVLVSDRAVVRTGRAPGLPRDQAARAHESVGQGDGMLGKRAEYDALFDAVAPGVVVPKGSR